MPATQAFLHFEVWRNADKSLDCMGEPLSAWAVELKGWRSMVRAALAGPELGPCTFSGSAWRL